MKRFDAPETRSEIVGLVLAAGQSSRMGTKKLSLPAGAMPLGSHALHAALASQLDRVLVVTQQEDPLDWIDSALFADDVRSRWCHIPCADAARGQAHSLCCGLQAADQQQADAVLILLADQPFVTTELINELIRHYKQAQQERHPNSYIAACLHGKPRPPVLFSYQALPLLMQLEGDVGARRLLRSGSSLQGKWIECDDPRLFLDVDTREDYEIFCQMLLPNEKTL